MSTHSCPASLHPAANPQRTNPPLPSFSTTHSPPRAYRTIRLTKPSTQPNSLCFVTTAPPAQPNSAKVNFHLEHNMLLQPHLVQLSSQLPSSPAAILSIPCVKIYAHPPPPSFSIAHTESSPRHHHRKRLPVPRVTPTRLTPSPWLAYIRTHQPEKEKKALHYIPRRVQSLTTTRCGGNSARGIRVARVARQRRRGPGGAAGSAEWVGVSCIDARWRGVYAVQRCRKRWGRVEWCVVFGEGCGRVMTHH